MFFTFLENIEDDSLPLFQYSATLPLEHEGFEGLDDQQVYCFAEVFYNAVRYNNYYNFYHDGELCFSIDTLVDAYEELYLPNYTIEEYMEILDLSYLETEGFLTCKVREVLATTANAREIFSLIEDTEMMDNFAVMMIDIMKGLNSSLAEAS